MKKITNLKQLIFVLDVDGVLTTGQFIYSSKGKVYKVFGPHDNDGLKMLKGLINIVFITADKRGFEISKKRIVDDMEQKLTLVTEKDRYQYLQNKYGLNNLIYMGDSYHDARIIKDCYFGIAPKNARREVLQVADFITDSRSGEGAVLDACLEVLKRFK
jgi:3-deoxy-D-manno-octulosonate 8-phosphate phosphatase (KDO 8-P phosphatase)